MILAWPAGEGNPWEPDAERRWRGLQAHVLVRVIKSVLRQQI